MGNTNTKLNKNDISTNKNQNQNVDIYKIKQLIDDAAIHYILTMNFDSLTKMYQKEYCDKLVGLTSSIFEKNLNTSEITFLSQLTKTSNDQLTSENKQMCNEIAKYYIQIAHIYAAIIKTINPIYVYKNSDGETVEIPFSKKKDIPVGVKADIKTFNICEKNINDLTCQINNNNPPPECKVNSSNISELMDEPGIPELQQLYQDDNYDYSDGVFKGMSAKTKTEYQNDLLLFYNVFTGNNNTTLPEDIKTFGDIKLSNYSNNLNNPSFISAEMDNKMNVLLKEYAENIKNMMHNMHSNRKILLDVINKLFIYSHNPVTNKKEIKINPNLKGSDLPGIILETRNAIVNLYLTCERDYTRGMEIYEAIVDKKILDSAEKQIEYFNLLLDKIHE